MPQRSKLWRWALVAMMAVLAGAVWAWRDYTEPGPLGQATVVVIAHGAGLRALEQQLVGSGVIAHPWIFRLGVTLEGKAGALKAGEYEFPAGVSPRAAAELLASGRVLQHRLTVPEGLSNAEIMALLQQQPGLEGEVEPGVPEGHLLPDTYFYVLGDRRQELVLRMRRAMDRTLAAAWAEREREPVLTTPEEALTLASIVEKETALEAERPRIAAVFLNRLKLGMRLQADPTVLYALTEAGAKPLDHPLGHEDLTLDSPYNTYTNKGLPPTPIANPGLAALDAVMHPAASEDLYFVADGNGGHSFARTLDEHNRNVAHLRRQQGAVEEQ
jgi:UPF0755 protein